MAILWETLGEGLSLATETDFRFGTDAVILSHFARPRKSGETVCELGTGCGVIPFLLLQKPFVPRQVLGVDIQEKAIDLCRLSAEKNSRKEVSFLCADWREPANIATRGSFDRVVCNPPYFPTDSGRQNDAPARRIARHEQADTLSSLCNAATYLLKYGGRFCVCHRPERLCDLVCALREHGLEPKRIQLVNQRQDAAPFLLLVDAVKGGKAGVEILQPLYLDKEAVVAEVYGAYRTGDTNE